MTIHSTKGRRNTGGRTSLIKTFDLDLTMSDSITHGVKLDVHVPSSAARLIVTVINSALVVDMYRRRLADVNAEFA